MGRQPSTAYRSKVARRQTLLGSYIAPEVVAHILSDGRRPLLSGVRLTVTVLFADIRGFTRLAHRLPAERVVTMLDEYFNTMSAAAVAHDGMIDKLIGDAIMVVYGVPPSKEMRLGAPSSPLTGCSLVSVHCSRNGKLMDLNHPAWAWESAVPPVMRSLLMSAPRCGWTIRSLGSQ